MGEKADAAESCAATQWDLARLRHLVDRNLMRFKKYKCMILNLVRNNPQPRLGADLLESSSAEKDLGVTKSG